MGAVENLKEKERMLKGLKNDLAELKALLIMKENNLEVNRQQIIDEMFEKIISLSKSLEVKSVKIRNLEDDAVAKSAEFSQTLSHLASCIANKDRLIQKLLEEIKEKNKMMEVLKQASQSVLVSHKTTDEQQLSYEESRYLLVPEEIADEQQLTLQETEPLSIKEEDAEEQELPAKGFESDSVKDDIGDQEEVTFQEYEIVLFEEDAENEQQFPFQDLDSPVTAVHTTWSAQRDEEDRITELQGANNSSSCPDVRRHSESGSHWSGGEGSSGQLSVASQIFECDACSDAFMSKYSLIRHVFKHLDMVPPPSDICELCGEVFPSALGLRKHSLTCLGVQYKTQERKCHCGNRAERQCNFCHKSLDQSNSLKRQLNTQNEDNPIANGLEKHFSHTKYHSAEKLDHKETSWKCDICGKSFFCPSTLTTHICTHTRDKSSKLQISSRIFSHLSNKNTHKRHHTREKQLICEVCGRLFSTLPILQRHTRVHTGEKPWNCENCDKAFGDAWSLKVHKRHHTGEKPHKCDICGKLFSSTSNLYVHKRIHTGVKPYKCKICSKSFFSLGALQSHKRAHRKETKELRDFQLEI